MSDNHEEAYALSQFITADPDRANDSDKLRNIADLMDAMVLNGKASGTDLQDFLRGLALRLELEYLDA